MVNLKEKNYMNRQPKLQLIYFNMRVLAKAPQLLTHTAGLKCNYLIACNFCGKSWNDVKSGVMFKKLPIPMVYKIHMLAQRDAILRYLADIAGMLPDDPIEADKIDSIS